MARSKQQTPTGGQQPAPSDTSGIVLLVDNVSLLLEVARAMGKELERLRAQVAQAIDLIRDQSEELRQLREGLDGSEGTNAQLDQLGDQLAEAQQEATTREPDQADDPNQGRASPMVDVRRQPQQTAPERPQTPQPAPQQPGQRRGPLVSHRPA